MTPRAARARRPAPRVKLKTPPLLFEKTQALLEPDPEEGRRDVPHLLDVHQRFGVRQRRDGACTRCSRPRGPQRADHPPRQVRRRLGHGVAADDPPAPPLHEAPHGPRAPQLRLGGHHAGPRRRHHRDGAAVLPDRRRHVPRARPLAPRPHEQPRGGQQRRGGPRHPPVERGDAAAARQPSTPTRSSTATSTPW